MVNQARPESLNPLIPTSAKRYLTDRTPLRYVTLRFDLARVAFLDVSRNQGATFNLYFGTETGIFSMVLEGIDADSSDWEDGIRVLGNARGLGRFVKIEGVTGSRGRFYLSEVTRPHPGDSLTPPTRGIFVLCCSSWCLD